MKKTYIILFFALSGLFLFSCDSAVSTDGEGTAGTENTTKEGSTAEEEEARKPVSYEDDFQSIKTAILRGKKDDLAKYTQLPDGKSLDELMRLFDDDFSEVLENTAYADLTDTEQDGKKLKDMNLTVTYGEEGEDVMESALILYLETQAEGLRIVQYLVAG